MTATRPLPFPAKLFRLLALWGLLGVAYFLIEVIWRLPKGEFPHPAMVIVGGLCGVAVGALNQYEEYFRLPVWLQCLIGTAVTLMVELIAGCVLNIGLGLGIWDYSHLPLNILGQICLPFALAWFILMPFAIWIEDRLRWGFGWNGKRYPIWQNYRDLITGR